jgi:SAM-dependent methyltransferase
MIDARLPEVLACPVCQHTLAASENELRCPGCAAVYRVAEGIPDLCPPDLEASGRNTGDPEPQARLRLRWDQERLLQDPSVQYLIQSAISRLRPGGRLLDTGAGTGILAAMLARLAPAGSVLYVTDLSRAMLALARQNLTGKSSGGGGRLSSPPPGCPPLENVLLFRADAHAPPYAACAFDVIVARLTPFALPAALHALRPGGTFISAGFGAAHWLELNEVFPTERRIRFGRHFTDDEQRGYWREAGFHAVETHGWRWEETHSLEELRDVLDFAPVIDAFDRDRDAPLLEALQERFRANGGVRLTHEPRVILGRKAA